MGYRSTNVYNDISVVQQPQNAADAARLYGEMRKEIEAEIKAAFCERLEGFNAEFVRVDLHRNPLVFAEKYRVFFKLNGQAHQVDVEFEDHERINNHELYARMLDKISKAIADEITKSLRLAFIQLATRRTA
jgi:hypothetical protein